MAYPYKKMNEADFEQISSITDSRHAFVIHGIAAKMKEI